MTSRISKRLLKDIETLHSDSLKQQGLYYWYDESNIQKGKALIIGHDGTAYEGLFGLFDIVVPQEYPFAPPQVLWKTSDGKTRFHPQLYVGGKVCLSILGTWNGPGWSSMMNLESVLQILQSLFVENPLACEPGYEKGTLQDEKFKNYREFVEHQSVQYMLHMLHSWLKGTNHHAWEPFKEEIEPILPTIFEKLKRKVLSHSTEQTWTTTGFISSRVSDWESMRNLLPKIEAAFLNTKKVE